MPTDTDAQITHQTVSAKDIGFNADKVSAQIGHYATPEFPRDPLDTLSDKGKQELYKDLGKSGNYWRERLVRYIQERQFSQYQVKDPDTRSTKPEEATTDMKSLLGKEGMKLYKKAIEEEANCLEFRNAAFRTATTFKEGESWTTRPVIVVAGPSGSGKSFAASAAIDKINDMQPSDPNDLSGNFIVAADGGVARDVSQVQRLTKDLAFNLGYTGISDLHKNSKPIREVKHHIKEAAFASPKMGLIIPETFARVIQPINNIIRRAERLKNTNVVFCRVVGYDKGIFKKIVNFMGVRRAWKTEGFDQQSHFDLNHSPHKGESKVYEAEHFDDGQRGSKIAEKIYKLISRDKLHMKVVNDLILVKLDPDNPMQWIRADPEAPADELKGAKLISERVYEKWLNTIQTSPISLEDFVKSPEGQLPPAIYTSVELDHMTLIKKMDRHIREALAQDNPLELGKSVNLDGFRQTLRDADLSDKESFDTVSKALAGYKLRAKPIGLKMFKHDKQFIKKAENLLKKADKQFGHSKAAHATKEDTKAETKTETPEDTSELSKHFSKKYRATVEGHSDNTALDSTREVTTQVTNRSS